MGRHDAEAPVMRAEASLTSCAISANTHKSPGSRLSAAYVKFAVFAVGARSPR